MEVSEVNTVKRSAVNGHGRDFGDLLIPQSHFLMLDYTDIKERNLEMKKKRLSGVSSEELEMEMLEYLLQEKGVKAVVVCFTDMEGKLQLLDYDKDFILSSHDNLTFDGSSIKGFTPQHESDLRLKLDWSSFRWVPADIFGAGKVLIFANVCDKDGSFYDGDYRSHLVEFSRELKKQGMVVNVAPEVEGFLLEGANAEQNFDEKDGFALATMGGYFNSLPQDVLRLFIDKVAEVQRALGFENEKDHPEVAPAQFELNYKYSVALDSADQIQLYKLVARQVAKSMGYTACFLPKPIAGMNGSGMHTNISVSQNGVNLFYDADGKYLLSDVAERFVDGVLAHAGELCLVLNSSVNAYRRLDPHYEAPNEIKVSSVDRGSMVRIPLGNEKSARIEVRTVAPDANPYLAIYSIVKAGFSGAEFDRGGEVVKLPGDIYSAIELFEKSEFMKKTMGTVNHEKYRRLKVAAADRSPKALGDRVKSGEVLYHHEVTNQMIWKNF